MPAELRRQPIGGVEGKSERRHALGWAIRAHARRLLADAGIPGDSGSPDATRRAGVATLLHSRRLPVLARCVA
jgi:hypothetical protein